ncbi:MAG: hypothetical protein AAF975_02425, partial [Spirochaetota bacterium]
KLSHINDMRIERSLENFAYGFSCSCIPSSVDFEAGDKVEVFWDEKQLGQGKDAIFCGYIDSLSVQLSGSSSSTTFSARSYALDLIDSVDSLAGIEGELADVVEKVCKSYSIPFSNTTKGKLGWVRFACENESPFRILHDLARAKGAMLVTNGWGALELARVKSDVLSGTLRLRDMVEVAYQSDISQCYHKYHGVIAGAEYQETDARVRKSRVLQLAADGESIGLLRSQLKNEKGRRYGLSQKLRLTVASWRAASSSTHWYENSNVWVEVPELGISKRKFFVYGVTLTLSKYNGYRAELLCCNREAFDLKASGSSASGGTASGGTQRAAFVTMSGVEKARQRRNEVQ